MLQFNIKSEMNLLLAKRLLLEVDGQLVPINNITLMFNDAKKSRPILNIKKVDGSYYGRVKNRIDYVKLTKNNFSTKIYGDTLNVGRWCDIEREKSRASQ
jgi:hypothetical protein